MWEGGGGANSDEGTDTVLPSTFTDVQDASFGELEQNNKSLFKHIYKEERKLKYMGKNVNPFYEHSEEFIADSLSNLAAIFLSSITLYDSTLHPTCTSPVPPPHTVRPPPAPACSYPSYPN